MNSILSNLMRAGLLAGALALAATGCSTTSSTKAVALKPATGSGVDLSKYEIASVLPFELAKAKPADPSIGAKFAGGIAARLQRDFGPLFKEVRTGSPLGQTNELIVTGIIRSYQPGSRFGRAMLIGLGAATFKGDVVLKDAADNRVLLSAPFSKLWAWGGALGASKGIEDMVAESEAAVATTVAQAKGWQPEPAAKTRP